MDPTLISHYQFEQTDQTDWLSTLGLLGIVDVALEFELDRDGEIVHLGKDGINAGVCAYALYYPSIDTSVVTLSNNESNVWKLQRELRDTLLPR